MSVETMSRLPPLPLYTLKGTMALINNLDFISPNLLCAATSEGKVHTWDLMTKRERFSFQVGTESCLSVFNVHNQLLTQEKGGIIHSWSLEEGHPTITATLMCPYVGFCKLEFNSSLSYDNAVAFAPGEDSIVNIVSLKNHTIISTLQTICEKLGEIMAMKYFELGGGSYLLTAYESGHIYLWDLNTRKYLNVVKIDGTVMDLDFDPQKQIGACGTNSNAFSIFKFDVKAGVSSVLKTVEITNPGVSRVRIRPDGKILALGCWDGRVRLYSWKTLKPLAVLPEHKQEVTDIIYSREEIPSLNCRSLMAVSGRDCRISLWNVYNDV